MQFPTFKAEMDFLNRGYDFVAGVDEVGVGPLAGPVVAATVILKPESIKGYRSKSKWYYRVRDSKTTYEHERANLVEEIKEHCIAYGIGEVQPSIIDKINIYNAALLAMKSAFLNMIESLPGFSDSQIALFIDGRGTIKDLNFNNVTQKAVVDGDASILSISAASIIAKVYRDNLLKELDLKHPNYGFAKHKGYNTKAHREAIKKFGPISAHRQSFLQPDYIAKSADLKSE